MFVNSVKEGAKKGLDTTLMLGKIIIPVYFFITFLSHTPALDYIAKLFEPFMNFFNLPGEAAIVLVMGNFLNLYAAIGAIKALSLNPFEVTVIALMLSFSHSLFMETAVVKKLKVSATNVVLLRVSLMLGIGLLYGTLLGGLIK
ncbi:hypothetical protein J2Z35_000029 [Acetoanaerobium pronyense]|uniref:Nucleoside transporter/FeoB GTPase Gate domain-containing protein n=1 Tax=Acetoanaerobium pronyense TaxID=1482736 RepID=A0ABS4KEQ8_9FIRM|nr:hypothetical protein [Acetoanaerobium pronyense]